jgi:hypothetical protein
MQKRESISHGLGQDPLTGSREYGHALQRFTVSFRRTVLHLVSSLVVMFNDR